MTKWIKVKDQLPPHKKTVWLKTGLFSKEKVVCDTFYIQSWSYPSGLFIRSVRTNDKWKEIND